MRPLQPLPRRLESKPFSRADALEAGVLDGRLRGTDLARPFRGVYAPAAPGDFASLCRALMTRLRPSDAISHESALLLWGAPVSPGERIHVTAMGGADRPTGVGIAGHRSDRVLPVVEYAGVVFIEPAHAWAQAARTLSRGTLIRVGDRLVSETIGRRERRPAVTTIDALRAALVDFRGSRGLVRARDAIEDIRTGVHSPPETDLRRAIVSFGLPEPVCQHPVAVGDGVLHPDLAWPELRIAFEYEGEGHLDRNRWRDDILRRERMEAAGWGVIRVTAADLASLPAFRSRVAGIRARRIAEL